jgi:hypothetical protein
MLRIDDSFAVLNMTINLTPELEALIKQDLERGPYRVVGQTQTKSFVGQSASPKAAGMMRSANTP